MGTVGVLAFENDNALDWVWQLEGAEDDSVLTETLEAAVEDLLRRLGGSV